jgi:hypothetical protein
MMISLLGCSVCRLTDGCQHLYIDLLLSSSFCSEYGSGSSLKHIVTCRGVYMTYRRVLAIDTLYIPLGSTGNTALSPIYTFYKSLGSAKACHLSSRSSALGLNSLLQPPSLELDSILILVEVKVVVTS